MTVLHKVRQPPCFNPCLNARCGHMCLRNRHGHVCACDAGFKLDHDNRTCIPLTDDDMDARFADAAVHDFCHPGCVHGRCILHRNQKLARCECSQGYSGARCDVSYHELSSGTLIVLIVTLLLVGLIGGTILLVLHRCTSQLWVLNKHDVDTTWKQQQIKCNSLEATSVNLCGIFVLSMYIEQCEINLFIWRFRKKKTSLLSPRNAVAAINSSHQTWLVTIKLLAHAVKTVSQYCHKYCDMFVHAFCAIYKQQICKQ